MSTLPASARRQRVIGALVGSAVGDALGAPFEFGLPGAYSRRFPASQQPPGSEMCGGGTCGWEPGEWTDDTQMALITAASLLAAEGLDEADLFAGYQQWVAAGPRDVGVQTGSVLRSRRPWQQAAAVYYAAGHRSAGNGSLMRTMPAAIFFARQGVEISRDAAERISALTHGDPSAGAGCAIYHQLVAVALAGQDPLAVITDALNRVPVGLRGRWKLVLHPDWTPHAASEPNGAVWPALGTAVWALRRFDSVQTGLRAVVDLGGDTDTVGCITGGLLGAVHGIQALPSRWTNALTGHVPGHPTLAGDLDALQHLAVRLDGQEPLDGAPPLGPGIEPVEVLPGLWLSDLNGAARFPPDALVISLCRAFSRVPHPDHRQVYLTDDANNLDIDTVLTDVLDTIASGRAQGRPVGVHCQGGASRTGLILRCWLRRSQGMSPREATAEARRLWPYTAGWNSSFDEALHRLSRLG